MMAATAYRNVQTGGVGRDVEVQLDHSGRRHVDVLDRQGVGSGEVAHAVQEAVVRGFGVVSHHEHGDGVVVTNHRAIVDHRTQSLKIEALTVKHGDGAVSPICRRP